MNEQKTIVESFVENLDELRTKLCGWWSKKGLDIFEDSEFLVTGLRKVDDETFEVDAFINIYLTNKDLFSAQITFKVLKRD